MVMPALAIAPMTATYCAQLRGPQLHSPSRGHRCAADGPSFAPSVATELRPLTPPPLAAA